MTSNTETDVYTTTVRVAHSSLSTVAEKDIAAAVARSAAAMIARRGRHGGRAIKVRFN